MSTTVGDVLAAKTNVLHRVAPDSLVYDALGLMAKFNVSGVLVTQGAELLGIFTERDYARKVVLQGLHSQKTTIDQVMTRQLLTVSRSETIDQVMQTMTDKRVRHLPVIEEGALIGIITIGDAVKAVIDEQAKTIRHLSGYIAGDMASG